MPKSLKSYSFKGSVQEHSIKAQNIAAKTANGICLNLNNLLFVFCRMGRLLWLALLRLLLQLLLGLALWLCLLLGLALRLCLLLRLVLLVLLACLLLLCLLLRLTLLLCLLLRLNVRLLFILIAPLVFTVTVLLLMHIIKSCDAILSGCALEFRNFLLRFFHKRIPFLSAFVYLYNALNLTRFQRIDLRHAMLVIREPHDALKNISLN